MYYIYKITNLITNKCYVGFTNNPDQRWKNHKNCKQFRPLYNSMKKHGKENFIFEIVYQHENREHVLLEKEPFYIQYFDAYNNGYNCTKGGEDTNTEQMRKNASERMKNNNPMKKLRINKGSFKKGHKPKITAERNEKIKTSKLGKNNPNYGNKNAANHMNVKITCEHCGKNVSKGNYYRWHGDKCKNVRSFTS